MTNNFSRSRTNNLTFDFNYLSLRSMHGPICAKALVALTLNSSQHNLLRIFLVHNLLHIFLFFAYHANVTRCLIDMVSYHVTHVMSAR